MWYAFFAFVVALFGLVDNASAASPLYLTTSTPLPNVLYASSDDYTFIAPYFADVDTKISVAITKAANPSNSTGGQPNSTPKQAASPTILLAAWEAGEAVFAVDCDLSSMLSSKSSITVTGVDQSAFNGKYNVVTVEQGTITAAPIGATQPANPVLGEGGTIAKISCPASSASSGTLNVAINVAPIPVRRAYLYLRKNAFYADTVNVSVGTDGMLSSSDSSSQQEVTAILDEIAQTLGGLAIAKVAPGTPTDIARTRCFQALNNLVQSGPYYREFVFDKLSKAFELRGTRKVEIETGSFQLATENVDATTANISLELETSFPSKGKVNIRAVQSGLVAFFPVPTDATVLCSIDDQTIPLSAPLTVYPYTESHFLDPQRDFLTGPQDTLTFSSGFIVGHKYSDQSAAKTVVDTVTSPIRALMPSVSVTQSTTVQSTGATSSTKSSTTTPSKGP